LFCYQHNQNLVNQLIEQEPDQRSDSLV